MPITSVLVANRGEIARRIFRTCRAIGVRTVAVYSDADADAPFVHEADVAVALGGLSAAESYLRTDAILEAARASGADAIHPGYGFLSENAAFAQAVVDAGLTWIGPTPSNISQMGTKVEAKALAVKAGVPTLPSGAIGSKKSDWTKSAGKVGYPLLVKASSGGGGKGMRAVHRPEDLVEAIEGAQREAASSFGDGTVFLERLLVGPRHIEIQIFGDTHGNVIHLGERDCSIQRRHQKIVEESPSPAVSDALRARMGEASVALGKAIGYVGAGTVEYLVDAAGEFYFLEMNTRLQVEHPVTEMVTGLDLVQWQLDVANGLPLPLTQDQVQRNGHAIEVRLYAEDPSNNFMPSVGTLHRFQVGSLAVGGVRCDSGVETGSVVSPHYDPMLAKVIAHAPTRSQAAGVLRRALQESQLHGVVTNVASLAAILGEHAFLDGEASTAYLHEHPDVLTARLPSHARAAHLSAILMARACAARQADSRWGFAPSGWRNVPTQGQQVTVVRDATSEPIALRYIVDGDTIEWFVRDHSHRSVVRPTVTPDTWKVKLDSGLSTMVCIHTIVSDNGEHWWANSADGQTELLVVPRFVVPNALVAGAGTTAPVPGRVVAVSVRVGDVVEEGQVLVVLEAMKMEHTIRAAAPATVVEVRVVSGDQVNAKQVLVILE
jgi:propionyl-CoA carboxylase alpha chain